jgi:16S rRNA (guanine527-N7)-methyltransferase
VVDVGSGGGAPGLPLAYALPDRDFVLLEAERRRCDFLTRWASPNTKVVWGRAEEQETDWAGVALAKALAPPPVAAEWCLPLVQPGGLAILWAGETADRTAVEHVAGVMAARLEDGESGLFVLRKIGPTPAGFPRRVGVAKKRPLAP